MHVQLRRPLNANGDRKESNDTKSTMQVYAVYETKRTPILVATGAKL